MAKDIFGREKTKVKKSTFHPRYQKHLHGKDAALYDPVPPDCCEYGKPDFWDERYLKNCETFEWSRAPCGHGTPEDRAPSRPGRGTGAVERSSPGTTTTARSRAS